MEEISKDSSFGVRASRLRGRWCQPEATPAQGNENLLARLSHAATAWDERVCE